ncbi:MFS transporter [Sphingobium fuliginis]|uniref:MFS transporter n=1 Tax=Sphingobium fuliginis ATCC 27551 TaxID=1208342 RepID=A0A5B8CG71_SPHSA|nr:MFS transporter [Sphingobium fuliginis]QDC37266.1 MFS transporter [Sphingobium fuliginis ATCC 27551]
MNGQIRIIAALWLWMLVNYLDRVAISFAGPAIMKSLSLSPASFGIILSSFSVGYLLSQIPGGLIADRWGARLVLIVGPLFWAFFTGLTGLVSTLAAFVVVRVLFGISEGLAVPAIHRLVGDRFEPRERARALAIGLTALAIAPAVAGPFVGKLVAAFGWQAMFFMMMGPALLAALTSYLLIPPAAPDHLAAPSHDDKQAGSVRAVLRERSFWLMAGSYCCYNIAFWGYLGWMPSYLALAHNIDLKAAGPIAGVPYLFAFLGLLFWGWLGTGPFHHRRPQLITCSLLLAGASLFIAYRADTLMQSVAGLSSAAFFLYGCQGSLGAVILDLSPPSLRGTYIGIVSTAGQIGGLVAPGIVGLLVSATGSFSSGFTFMALALCTAAVGMFVLSPLVAAKNALARGVA